MGAQAVSPRVIRGHDYRSGSDVEMTRAQWRDLCDSAVYTRRVGGDVLGFQRDPITGRPRLAFEIYDEGALKLRRSTS